MPPKEQRQQANARQCTDCDFITYSSFLYARHKRQCTSKQGSSASDNSLRIERYKCTKCDWSTRESHELLRHRITAHKERLVIFECSQCSYAAETQQCLALHMDLWHPASNYDIAASDPSQCRDSETEVVQDATLRSVDNAITSTKAIIVPTSVKARKSAAVRIKETKFTTNEANQCVIASSLSQKEGRRVADSDRTYLDNFRFHRQHSHGITPSRCDEDDGGRKELFFKIEKAHDDEKNTDLEIDSVNTDSPVSSVGGGSMSAQETTKFSRYFKTTDGSYLCSECSYSSCHEASMRRHRAHHILNGPLKCPTCTFTASSSRKMLLHVNSCHPDSSALLTSLKAGSKAAGLVENSEGLGATCIKNDDAISLPNIIKPDDLLQVMPEKSVSEKTLDEICIKIRCCFCWLMCPTRAELFKHCHSAHPADVYYACDKCTATFASAGGLKRHKTRVHSNKFSLSLDETENNSEPFVIKTEPISDEEDAPAVSYEVFCNEPTDSDTMVKSSDELCTVVNVEEGTYTTIHNKEPSKQLDVDCREQQKCELEKLSSSAAAMHQCPCCTFTARKLVTLERHAMTHPDAKLYSCLYCPFNSVFKYCMELHLEKNHKVEMARGDGSLKKLVSLCYQPGMKQPDESSSSNVITSITVPAVSGVLPIGELKVINSPVKNSPRKSTKDGNMVKKAKRKFSKVSERDSGDASDADFQPPKSLKLSKSSHVESSCNATAGGNSENDKPELVNESDSPRSPRLEFIYCRKCAYKTKSRPNMKNHEEAHENLRRFECTKCGMRMNTRHTMSIHFTTAHQNVKVSMKVLSRALAKKTLDSYLSAKKARKVTTRPRNADSFENLADSNEFNSAKSKKFETTEQSCYLTTQQGSSGVDHGANERRVEKIVIRKVTRSSSSSSSKKSSSTGLRVSSTKRLSHNNDDKLDAVTGGIDESDAKGIRKEASLPVQKSTKAGGRGPKFILMSDTKDKIAKLIKLRGIPLWKCLLCKFKIKSKYQLMHHFETHKQLLLYSCPVCGFRSNYVGNLRKHVFVVHGLKDVHVINMAVTDIERVGSSEGVVSSDAVVSLENKPAKSTVSSSSSRTSVSRNNSTPSKRPIAQAGSSKQNNSPHKSPLAKSTTEENESPRPKRKRSSGSSVSERKKCELDSASVSDVSSIRSKSVIPLPTADNDSKDNHAVSRYQPFQCSGCGFRSTWYSAVFRHLRSKHVKNKCHVLRLSEDEARQSCTGHETSQQNNSTNLDPINVDRNTSTDSKPSIDLPAVDGNRGVRRLKCSECDAMYEWRRSIQRHIAQRHPNAVVITLSMSATMKLYSCEDPSLAAQQNTSVKTTGKKKELRYRCEKCSFEANDIHRVIEHIKSVHGSTKKIGVLDLSCDEAVSRSSSVLTSNNSASQGVISNQSRSNKKVKTSVKHAKKNLRKLKVKLMKKKSCVSSSRFSKSNKCKLCPFTTDRIDHMGFHGHMHVERPGWKFRCDVCPYFTMSKGVLNRHLLLHRISDKPSDEMVTEQDRASSPRTSEVVSTRRTVAQKTSASSSTPTKPAFKSVSSSSIASERSTETKDVSNDDVEHEKEQTHSPVKRSLLERAPSLKNYARKTGVVQKVSTQARQSFAGSYSSRSPTSSVSLASRDEENQKWACEKCFYRTCRAKRFRAHVSLHGSKQRYECEYCDYSVPTFYALLMHRKGHFLPNPNLQFRNLHGLVNLTQLPGIDDDDDCEQWSKTECDDLMENADDFVLPSRIFRCERCPFSCAEYYSFVAHFRHHLVQSEIVCPFCDYSAPAQTLVSAHAVLHFNLPGCEWSAQPKSQLNSEQMQSVIDEIDELCRNSTKRTGISSMIVKSSEEIVQNDMTAATVSEQVLLTKVHDRYRISDGSLLSLRSKIDEKDSDCKDKQLSINNCSMIRKSDNYQLGTKEDIQRDVNFCEQLMSASREEPESINICSSHLVKSDASHSVTDCNGPQAVATCIIETNSDLCNRVVDISHTSSETRQMNIEENSGDDNLISLHCNTEERESESNLDEKLSDAVVNEAIAIGCTADDLCFIVVKPVTDVSIDLPLTPNHPDSKFDIKKILMVASEDRESKLSNHDLPQGDGSNGGAEEKLPGDVTKCLPAHRVSASEDNSTAEAPSEKDIVICDDTSVACVRCDDTPVGAARCADTPVGNVRCDYTPVGAVRCDDTPVDAMKCNDTPVGAMSCDDTPVGAMRCDDTPVGAMRCDDTPVGAMSCDDTPVGAMRCDDTPVGDVKGECVPVKVIKTDLPSDVTITDKSLDCTPASPHSSLVEQISYTSTSSKLSD